MTNERVDTSAVLMCIHLLTLRNKRTILRSYSQRPQSATCDGDRSVRIQNGKSHTGCTAVATGCDRCRSAMIAMRLRAKGRRCDANWCNLPAHPYVLNRPLPWLKPSRGLAGPTNGPSCQVVRKEPIAQALDTRCRGDPRRSWGGLTQGPPAERAYNGEC